MDISGKQIGLWMIGEELKRGTRKYYSCICSSCGSKKDVRSDALLSGGTKSCLRCALNKRNQELATHRESNSRLYRIWAGIKSRIKDEEKNYLSIGVKICPEWSFYINFRDWAKANGYKENLTIERKDTLGDYEPSNCTFVSNKEQQANKLNTIRLQDGSMAWTTAQVNGITRNAFDNRIRRGWGVEEACTIPLDYSYARRKRPQSKRVNRKT